MIHKISMIPILFIAACSSAKPTATTIDDEARTAEGVMLTAGQMDPSCETFCVKVEKPVVQVGKPIKGVITWRDAPPDSVLSLSLNRLGEDRQHIQKEKKERFDGSLLTNVVPISGNGSIRFDWPGNGFGCFSTEIPEICPGKAAPGSHTISAEVMDKKTLVHPFAHPDKVRNAKPKIIFSGKSQTFEIR